MINVKNTNKRIKLTVLQPEMLDMCCELISRGKEKIAGYKWLRGVKPTFYRDGIYRQSYHDERDVFNICCWAEYCCMGVWYVLELTPEEFSICEMSYDHIYKRIPIDQLEKMKEIYNKAGDHREWSRNIGKLVRQQEYYLRLKNIESTFLKTTLRIKKQLPNLVFKINPLPLP